MIKTITCFLQLATDAFSEMRKTLESIGFFSLTTTPPWSSLTVANRGISSALAGTSGAKMDDWLAKIDKDQLFNMFAIPLVPDMLEEDNKKRKTF